MLIYLWAVAITYYQLTHLLVRHLKKDIIEIEVKIFLNLLK